MTRRILLIDIDGTVSEDIPNEEAHRFSEAKVLPGSKDMVNKWYDEGHDITFFTARTSEHRDVTLQWLDDNGFKYHRLITDKPRIKDGEEYIWIDNRPVKAVTYLGVWSELVEKIKKIKIFK